MVHYLLQHKACPSLADRHGNNCIHLAVLHNATQCLQVMLGMKVKVNLNDKNFEGQSYLYNFLPLHVLPILYAQSFILEYITLLP